MKLYTIFKLYGKYILPVLYPIFLNIQLCIYLIVNNPKTKFMLIFTTLIRILYRLNVYLCFRYIIVFYYI